MLSWHFASPQRQQGLFVPLLALRAGRILSERPHSPFGNHLAFSFIAADVLVVRAVGRDAAAVQRIPARTTRLQQDGCGSLLRHASVGHCLRRATHRPHCRSLDVGGASAGRLLATGWTGPMAVGRTNPTGVRLFHHPRLLAADRPYLATGRDHWFRAPQTSATPVWSSALVGHPRLDGGGLAGRLLVR